MTPDEAMEALGSYVVARYSCGGAGEWGRGKVVSYSIAPTFTIEREDGTRFDWRYDLCEVIDAPTVPDEAERLALFIANRRDGEQWRSDCPEWVRERYREAARVAWQHVLDPKAQR